MSYNEYLYCSHHANRQIAIRREAESMAAFKKGSVLLSAMLAEGKIIDEVLYPLSLSYEEKMEYVARNSMFINADDKHEGIQIVWAEKQAVLIHRLLSSEFRREFDSHWLGVWSEPVDDANKSVLIESMKSKVTFRENLRRTVGYQGEINFAKSPAVSEPTYRMRG